ncbi:hypothetical protein FS815_17200 [Agrobacterium vitis]|nr:hypothetical protein [Allorhizobium ampelinum]
MRCGCPPQPRPAPGRPSADRLQGGENWISKRGECSVPIDKGASGARLTARVTASSSWRDWSKPRSPR